MLCEFERLLYPYNAKAVETGSYMVAIYRPCEKIIDQVGESVKRIKAVGYGLPIADNIRFNLHGHWSKDSKYGIQFEVETFDEVITPTKEAIIAYLSSGQIKGIGPKLAERIYDLFGNDTLDVLDKEPDKLLLVTGINSNKLKKICDSYLANRGARDIIAFLVPYGITPNRAIRLYKEYGKRTMDIVKNHPFQLCELTGVGFKTADRIAASMGIDSMSTERIDEGLIYTLTEAESRGNLCMEKHAFIKACLKLLDTSGLTEDMLTDRAFRLVTDKRLVTYGDMVYKAKTAYAEKYLADKLRNQLSNAKCCLYKDLDAELASEEKKLKLKLAPEQQEAVKMALTEGVSIITGGPGTGKTLIQKAILDIYRKNNPYNDICCCAPTGRAARRMAQSTGFYASTIHKALGLLAGDDGSFNEPESIKADLILIDEVSMLDIYLAGSLLGSIKPKAQLILIGDAEQLPSVGPGAVLSEMIDSGCVPVVRLDKVFRQNSGSRIATNAKVIRHGNLNLEYGDDFQFIESASLEESAKIISDVYLREVGKYGVDNVALLSPYRQKTDTGVNALNDVLHNIVNPYIAGNSEAVFGSKKFRKGDKVMQIKNHEDINNGDVGYITKLINYGDDLSIQVDFGDGRTKAYDSSEIDMLEFGYASTIHKSQGSEYRSVIINLQCAHTIMLTRPLIYTAITRGKERVIIVGERKALCIAIKRTDTDKRGTCLAKRLQELI